MVNEMYTSQTCSVCGENGIRRGGQFKCSCGAELNADYNGSRNIMKRGLGLVSKLGATSELAHNHPYGQLSPMMRMEAPSVRVG